MSGMTDEELGEFLGFTPEETKIAIPRLTPEKRAGYEALCGAYREIRLWEEGVGPLPKGVMIDTDRSTKRRRAWR